MDGYLENVDFKSEISMIIRFKVWPHFPPMVETLSRADPECES